METVFANRACGVLYRFIRKNGGRYLLPANVCPVVPLTFLTANVDFEFADIDLQTLCIDEQACLSCLNGGTFDGLVFVHTYGTGYNPQGFFEKLKNISAEFRIIDDRCLCIPDVQVPTTIADLTLYSTGYAKYVDLGKGAFAYLGDHCSLSSEELAYNGIDIGPVYKEAFRKGEKISEIPDGWLDATVSELFDTEYFNQVVKGVKMSMYHKREINSIYSDLLKDVCPLSNDFNQWRFNILVENKEQVMNSVFENGMFASSHYQPASRLFVDKPFPNAEHLYDQVINLFNDKYIDEGMASRLSLLIRDVVMKERGGAK